MLLEVSPLSWYVYMLRCAPDTLYTGSTPDPAHRLRQHLGLISGGAKYTRAHPPRALAALWSVPDARAAHSLEWHIKRFTRAQKLRLIAAPDTLSALFGDPAMDARALDLSDYDSFFNDLS